MKVCISVLTLILVMAAVAAMMYRFCGKREKQRLQDFYIFIFYAIILYGVMSFIKMALGEPEENLFGSFYDMEAATYIHYGVPMLAMTAVVAFLHGRLLKNEFVDRFVMLFNSMFWFAAMAVFSVLGEVSNRCIVISMTAAALISLLVNIFYKGKIEYCCRQKVKERLIYILPVVMLWVVTVFIFEPNQLLLNNLGEFELLPYTVFFVITVSAALLITCIYTLVSLYVLSDRQLKLFGALLFGAVFAGYIQANFMNGEMKNMDGTTQDWDLGVKMINGVVWGIIMLVSVFINLLNNNKKIKKVCPLICIYLCLTQAVSLTYMIVSFDFPDREKEVLITKDHALELNSRNNVIVFVLDWFDQQIMDELRSEDPEIDTNLADFSCYHNTSSCYAFTGQSVPYMLTHIEWENGMSDEEYAEYAYQNGTLLQDIKAQGYSIGVYTENYLVTKPAKELLINYSERVDIKLKYVKTIATMSRTSKYKMAPFIVKEKFNYTTSDIWQIAIINNNVWPQNDDIAFYEMLGNGLSVAKEDTYSGAFRFYHLKGAHPPFDMDDAFGRVTDDIWKVHDGNQLSQSRGVLKIVFEYIQNMKNLGIYEDATIIITADHGQNLHIGEKSDNPEEFDLTSSPILYVKLPNEHSDQVRYSNAPVSHTEFAASVISAVGGDASLYGRTFAQIPEDESRERGFVFADGTGKIIAKYRISGDVNDISSWHKEE